MRKEEKPARGLLVGGFKPSARPKSAPERAAKAAESRRRQPYEVVCEIDQHTITFGYVGSEHGGYVLALARLVPWAKNPRVQRREL